MILTNFLCNIKNVSLNFQTLGNVSDEKLRFRMLARRLTEIYSGKWPLADEFDTADGSGYNSEYFPVDDEIGVCTA